MGNAPGKMSKRGGAAKSPGGRKRKGKASASGSSTGWTKLHTACRSGALADVQALIRETGSDVNAPTQSGWTPLHTACHAGQTDVVKWLVTEGGADTTRTTDKGSNALHSACFAGKADIARWLVTEAGMNANARTGKGLTPLHIACHAGQLAAAQAMVELARAALTATSQSGLMPLHTASYAGQLRVVQWLVKEAGVDPNQRTNKGWTPLHSACYTGSTLVAQWLVSTGGADVNAVTSVSGLTPLHTAAREGHTEIAQWLAGDGGADTGVRAKDGSTAADLARANGHPAIAGFLEQQQRRGSNPPRTPAAPAPAPTAAPAAAAATAGAAAGAAAAHAHSSKGDSPTRGHGPAAKKHLSAALDAASPDAVDRLERGAAWAEAEAKEAAQKMADAGGSGGSGFVEMAAAGINAADRAFAAAGTVFPPMHAARAFTGVFKLCWAIRQRYKAVENLRDKTVPDLLERVDALETALRSVRDLRVLSEPPAALERLLTEAHELCEKCLPAGEEGEKGWRSLASRAWTFLKTDAKSKAALFEDVHRRLTLQVGDLTFLVQVQQYEAHEATREEAAEQRYALLNQLTKVEDLQQRMERSRIADDTQRRHVLARLSDTAEAARKAARAAQAAAEENGRALSRQEELMQEMLRRLPDAGPVPAGAVDSPTEEAVQEVHDQARIPRAFIRPWSDVRDADDPERELNPQRATPLGEGGFGVVYRAKLRCFGARLDDVAVKMLDADALAPQDVAAFRHEVAVQVQCAGHPSVLGVRAAVVERERRRYALITDLCACDLNAVVHQNREVNPTAGAAPWRWSRLSLRQRLAKLAPLVGAVDYLHAMRISHNDLKPGNVLARADTGALVITDFGLARTLATATRTATADAATNGDSAPALTGGTYPYMAPEQLGAAPRPRPESDVYSLAMLLFEGLDRVAVPSDLRTREEAYAYASHVADRIDLEDLRAAELREGLGGLCDMIRAALSPKRGDRPTARGMAASIGEMLARPPPPEDGSAQGSEKSQAERPSSIREVNVSVSGGTPASGSPSAVSSQQGTPAQSRSRQSKIVAYLQERPREEWTLQGAAEASNVTRLVESLGLEELGDLLEVVGDEEGLEGVRALDKKRFLREVQAYREFVGE